MENGGHKPGFQAWSHDHASQSQGQLLPTIQSQWPTSPFAWGHSFPPECYNLGCNTLLLPGWERSCFNFLAAPSDRPGSVQDR